jgi:hypothetical protein
MDFESLKYFESVVLNLHKARAKIEELKKSTGFIESQDCEALKLECESLQEKCLIMAELSARLLVEFDEIIKVETNPIITVKLEQLKTLISEVYQ